MSNWRWFFATDEALPDTSLFLSTDAVPVKRNPVRSVSRVRTAAGQVYYVKRDTPHGFAQCLKAFLRCKNRSEFLTSQWLQKEGLPCLRYIALGRCFPESVLVSRELAGYLPSMQFWCDFPEQRTGFLQALCALVRLLNGKKILHPDFHAGNLMCRADNPADLVLIDLFGIHRTRLRDPMEANCRIFTEFAADLRPGYGETLVAACGADKALWDILLAKNRARVLAEWPRREKQILSGNSKFVRTETIDGQIFHIRNSRWFASMPFQQEHTVRETSPFEQARGLWLDSFRKELLHEKTRVPLALRRDGGNAVLYYEK